MSNKQNDNYYETIDEMAEPLTDEQIEKLPKHKCSENCMHTNLHAIPTIELENDKYYAHLMEVVMNEETEKYMQWFKDEGHELYLKWKEEN